MQVLILSPEAPYPLSSGGAYRTASLLHYFARFAEVDLISISENGKPALLPEGLIRRQHVIPLPVHSNATAARYLRNAGRMWRKVPPLIDRVSGLGREILAAASDRTYDVCVIEHFWCAPYVDLLRARCARVLLDLHNVESLLHSRCAMLESDSQTLSNAFGSALVRAGHRRFSVACEKLERDLLGRFDAVLATSGTDAEMVRSLAPNARSVVYPNALPDVEVPVVPERDTVVFSGNFQYHPNIDAVQYLVQEIWPQVRKEHPSTTLRLVGRGDSYIRHAIANRAAEQGIETTGPVEDAQKEIAAARVVIAPLRAGSGTRIKILEAWACERCVVATPLAAEGLTAEDGMNIRIATTPIEFSHTLSALLRDSAQRAVLGREGRRVFKHKYTWPAVWRGLDQDLQLNTLAGLNSYTGSL